MQAPFTSSKSTFTAKRRRRNGGRRPLTTSGELRAGSLRVSFSLAYHVMASQVCCREVRENEEVSGPQLVDSQGDATMPGSISRRSSSAVPSGECTPNQDAWGPTTERN